MNGSDPATGPHVFVTPPAVPGEVPTGTEQDPFTSVKDGISAAQSGGTVHLHAGHYVESVRLQQIAGQESHRILVQPFGDGAVFIDSMLPEFLNPTEPDERWDPVTAPNGEFHGEYVWQKQYPAPGIDLTRRGVGGGALLEESVHVRLVSYSQLIDLLAENQVWPDTKPGPADGNRVWRLDDAPEANGTYIPETRDGRFHRRPSVYMGPGVWFDERSSERRVHIRLAPTNNNIPGWEDYEAGETDPNNIRLALCRDEDYAIFATNCHHITFRNLELRYGNPDTVRLNTCSDISFDHCRIRSGTRAFMFLTGNAADSWNEDIRIEHCVIDGGIPTWFFRSDRKDEYRMGPTDKDVAVQSETMRNRLGASTSGVQIAGSSRNKRVTVHHCEIFNAHDSYIFGDEMEFHHNWVHNLNDDGIALSADADTRNAKIYCNVVTQTLTALSFASNRAVGPVYIVGNLFDLRRPTMGRRPTGEDTGVPDSLRQGHFFKDGVDEGVIELSHNTCVVLDPGAKGDNLLDVTDAGYSYFINIGLNSDMRRAFNNILVAVYTSPVHVRPIAFLAPESFSTESDGNIYFRIPAGDPGSINFQVRVKIGDEVEESAGYATLGDYRTDQWPPDGTGGYEQSSVLTDPRFKSFDTATGMPLHGDDFRLRSDSPGKLNVAPLPTDQRQLYADATGEQPLDRGCYPPSGARLKVGVDGRRIFPRMRLGLGNGTHPDDIPPVFLDND
jgi:hypothetical protein